MEVVKKTGTKDQLAFFDSEYRILRHVKKARAGYHIMPRTHSYAEVKKAVRLFDPPILHIDPSFYNDEVVSYAKEHDARLWINALGDTDDAYRNGDKDAIAELLEGGANVVQTDIPELMLDYLRQKNLHW